MTYFYSDFKTDKCILKVKFNEDSEEIIVDNTNIDTVYDKMTYATFGVNDKEITDTKYRNARVLNKDKFDIKLGLSRSQIKYLDQLIIAKLISHQYFTLTKEKLNIYKTGDFFNEHRDTPEKNLLATLVVCLPFEFSGGDFGIVDDVVNLSKNSTSLQFIIFYPEMRHKVFEVTKGYRVTATYAIRAIPRDFYLGPDSTSFPIKYFDFKREGVHDASDLTELSLKKHCAKHNYKFKVSKDYEFDSPYSSDFESNPKTINTTSINTLSLIDDPIPDGLELGYFCENFYTNTDTQNLKGNDYKFYEMCVKKGLKVDMVRITISMIDKEFIHVHDGNEYNRFLEYTSRRNIDGFCGLGKDLRKENFQCNNCKQNTFYIVKYPSNPDMLMCPKCFTKDKSFEPPEIYSKYFILNTNNMPKKFMGLYNSDSDIEDIVEIDEGSPEELCPIINVHMWLNTFQSDYFHLISRGRAFYGNTPCSKYYSYGLYALIISKELSNPDDKFLGPLEYKCKYYGWCTKQLFSQ